eukprot:5279157-Prymnesium_polylepis.1
MRGLDARLVQWLARGIQISKAAGSNPSGRFRVLHLSSPPCWITVHHTPSPYPPFALTTLCVWFTHAELPLQHALPSAEMLHPCVGLVYRYKKVKVKGPMSRELALEVGECPLTRHRPQ